MIKTTYLKIMVILAFASTILLPGYFALYLTPSINSLVIKNTEKHAICLGSHLVAMLQNEQNGQESEYISSTKLASHDEHIRKNFGLKKIKLFSPTGEVTFSSDPKDIGKINKKTYFHERVAKGDAYTKVVKKDEKSLEDQVMTFDVVETYVPIMKGDSFEGAFEIYYDITETKREIEYLITQAIIILLVVSSSLLIAIIYNFFKARDNIIECQRLECKLKEAATTDELTGLLNRRGFMELATHQLTVSERMHEGLFLLYFDIDNMKMINDKLGHKVGDLALIEMAGILKNTYRKSDIISRIGGDEFAVLHAFDPDPKFEKFLEQRFYDNLKILNNESGRSFELQASIGMMHYNPEAPCSLDELVFQADSLMYEAKRKKKVHGDV